MDSAESWVRHSAARMEEAGLYFGHGTDNALDEAVWLVLHVLQAPLDGSFSDWGRALSSREAEQVQALLEKRISSRQPLAYLLGVAWFCGLPFRVSADVLVPRSPFAELIQNRLQPWLGSARPQRALDLCCGSGCIGIALALAFPELQVDLADISLPALDIARENVTMHGCAARVSPRQSDGFEALAPGGYDLILSNPPYVPRGALATLPAEYQAEPALGLASGEDGLDLPLRLLRDAPDFMQPEALLFMEVGESEQRLDAALAGVPLTWLAFAEGGSGVFMVERETLMAARPLIAAALEQRNHVG